MDYSVSIETEAVLLNIKVFSVDSADTCGRTVGLCEYEWTVLHSCLSFKQGNIQKVMIQSTKNAELMVINGQYGDQVANYSRCGHS